MPPQRTPWQAHCIGLIHGIGGSGGVGVLLLAAIHNVLALVALGLLAGCTAISMAVLSTGFGSMLGRPRMQLAFARIVPAFGAFGICFEAWYALGALAIVPYVF